MFDCVFLDLYCTYQSGKGTNSTTLSYLTIILEFVRFSLSYSTILSLNANSGQNTPIPDFVIHYTNFQSLTKISIRVN